ncbi:hypothetical protein A3Q56_02816 [Intoshia linei]|uniref:Uncharacterized protein n=1 Tax=Intoshia linei TaxID=1819745 RepID=A0A177B6W1_9BILA|nr:hypothetical protein A3Q56_02816 [Intoshia linei]
MNTLFNIGNKFKYISVTKHNWMYSIFAKTDAKCLSKKCDTNLQKVDYYTHNNMTFYQIESKTVGYRLPQPFKFDRLSGIEIFK